MFWSNSVQRSVFPTTWAILFSTHMKMIPLFMNIVCSCIDLQWRKRKRYNGDDIGDVLAQKQGRQKLTQPLYITLANESPPRPSAAEDSEDAIYDSDLHGQETGTYIDWRAQPYWLSWVYEFIEYTHTLYNIRVIIHFIRQPDLFVALASLRRVRKLIFVWNGFCLCGSSHGKKNCINATKLGCFRAQLSVVHLFLNFTSRR